MKSKMTVQLFESGGTDTVRWCKQLKLSCGIYNQCYSPNTCLSLSSSPILPQKKHLHSQLFKYFKSSIVDIHVYLLAVFFLTDFVGALLCIWCFTGTCRSAEV